MELVVLLFLVAPAVAVGFMVLERLLKRPMDAIERHQREND